MPGTGDIYRNKRVGWGLLFFGGFMFVMFVASCVSIALFHKECPRSSLILGAAWIIGTPVYFFVEHIYFFRKFGKPDEYEQFKRLQDQAAKIWAAAIIVLAAFFTETLR